MFVTLVDATVAFQWTSISQKSDSVCRTACSGALVCLLSVRTPSAVYAVMENHPNAGLVYQDFRAREYQKFLIYQPGGSHQFPHDTYPRYLVNLLLLASLLDVTFPRCSFSLQARGSP